uniref:Reverse transcriptase Ty1/copia-type domain-containing protein n=1 Tax=Peronospora matthiolae TaxID=2874970 RepID=A0AAV1UVG8_9STRA
MRDKEGAGGDAIMAALEAHATETNDEPHKSSLLHWHQRLGRLAFDTIKRMACHPHQGYGSATINSQQDSGKHSPIDRIGGVICSDLKGPMTPRDRLGNRYLLNFADRKSNYCRVFLARTKDAWAKQFKAFLVHFEKLFGFERTGIACQVSEARNQASNGKAERIHRTVLNLARSVMFACALPLMFWGDAGPAQELAAAALGARHHCRPQRGTKGCKVLLPRDNKVVVTQHIKNIKTLTEAQNVQLQRAMDVGDRAGVQEETDAPAAAVANDGCAEGNRATRKSRKRWARAAHGTRGASKRAEAAARQDETSASGEVAMRSGKREGWEKAMQASISALEANEVWTITRRTAGQHALHTKWVYKTKTYAQGDLERQKARLVACGNEQVIGVDYTLTFAAVMDLSTVEVILALAATWMVPATHGDIPNAYVEAEKEPHLHIYLQMPRNMPVSKETLRAQGVSNASELVLELRKSLYGLKQAGRLWSQLLHSKLSTAGFTRSTGTSAAAVEPFFASLASLSNNDLGRVSKFLGTRATHNGQNGYTLDQERAIRDNLRDNGLADANSTWTPIDDSCYEL